jgi:hypothetical protein
MGTHIVGLSELLATLEHVQADGPRQFKGVVSRGALNVKRDWRQGWSHISHAPHIPRSIDYDLDSTGDEYEAEIGPNMDLGPQLQGFLGRILEYGNPEGTSAPNPAGLRALTVEEPRFVAAVEKVAMDLLDGP